MITLGLNSAYHESAACITRDGAILAAVEEERFNRVKHGKPARIDNPHELPLRSIEYCLGEAGAAWSDVDRVGFSINPERRLLNKDFDDAVVEGDWGSASGETRFYELLSSVPELLAELGFRGEFSWLDHHLCHAASAFYPSSFAAAAVLTVDGIGETTTTSLGMGEGASYRLLEEIGYPRSIGFLWEKFSKFLGFSEYDAYKVMGLAAYGDPARFRQRLASVAWCNDDGTFGLNAQALALRVEDYSGLERILGVPRRCREAAGSQHADIAAALQEATNQLMLGLVRRLHDMTGARDLCLAGGVALNCVANEWLFERGPFERLFVQPASHDAGTALGAAAYLAHAGRPASQRQHMADAYLGPAFNAEETESALRAAKVPYQVEERIEDRVAELLASGSVVARFNGRMEFGPRALGNRSLLADPRRRDVKELLNARVKHREEFRPFAPSVLAEALHDWLLVGKPTSATEFMLMTHRARPELADRIPGVVHVDGTSRVHAVSAEQNPSFHRLISAFGRLTDVPIVLNTSLNDSEPIVCSPADALRTFLGSNIDALAIDRFLVSRPG